MFSRNPAFNYDFGDIGQSLSQDIFALPANFEQTDYGASTLQSGVQYVGFKLHSEEFLLEMVLVREIIMLPMITYVPHSNPSIEGIVALRGEIMPVLNIRRFLTFPKGHATPSTRVVILESELGGFGMIVDEITEFVWLQPSDIESIDQNVFGSQYKILLGVAKLGNKMRGVVDITKLLLQVSPNCEENKQ